MDRLAARRSKSLARLNRDRTEKKDAGYERDTFPLDEQTAFSIPKDAQPREKILKLGRMITDRIPAKTARPDGGRPGILGPGGRGDG